MSRDWNKEYLEVTWKDVERTVMLAVFKTILSFMYTMLNENHLLEPKVLVQHFVNNNLAKQPIAHQEFLYLNG